MTNRVINIDQNRDASASLIEDLRNHGQNVNYLEGSSGLWPDDEIIRTGSLGLDIAIGVGGFPRGKVGEIYGEESSGKSTSCIHMAREAQAAGLPVLYIDSEYALDPEYCRKIGVDIESMIVSQPDNLEQALNMIIMLCNERDFNGLIILDSIPSLLPKSMMEGDIESEGRRAAMASVYSRAMPIIKQAVKKSGATLFMVNQTRSTMATMPYAKQTDTPGGKALKFAYDIRIEVRRSVDSDGKRSDTGIEWQECQARVIKNKVSSPFKSGSFTIWKDGTGINWAYDVLENALRHDIIIEDHKFDGDNEPIRKKGWFCTHLGQKDFERIHAASPDLEFFEVEMPDANGVLKTRYFFQQYRWNKFVEVASESDEFIAVLEEGVLESLNKGATFSDVDDEAAEESSRIEGDEEEDGEGDSEE